ncbi:2Fe-2S iron-sulfur cluster-binding protein [Aquimarina litoralis]|uniref:2Fe-2S iron-sulfur cluster-binding protein n=1 Tax=Aquimarina litoralis TaxID=584605 RepID=UPI001C583DA3|nr:2Fe-2S iron-sulfur cluster-binding protein [Aquimarina litoralis]MBW1294420.1 2Fe-2S iron-sulfur cluster binding domain-containing protein [Aquimarina litoralis]
MKNPLQVTIIDSFKEVHKINFKRYEYPNLMELIIDNYCEEIGDCGGRGMCKTCFVKLVKNPNKEDKDSLKINFTQDPNTMDYLLACQIIVDDCINEMTFKILNDN